MKVANLHNVMIVCQEHKLPGLEMEYLISFLTKPSHVYYIRTLNISLPMLYGICKYIVYIIRNKYQIFANVIKLKYLYIIRIAFWIKNIVKKSNLREKHFYPVFT